ncbi:hypothetical protein HDU76_010969 [Blyttiomyces sp. JEL0837]|nr:hypothetical protein HDU76_010969 [Blyttiomyces sp. JEL0837]
MVYYCSGKCEKKAKMLHDVLDCGKGFNPGDLVELSGITNLKLNMLIGDIDDGIEYGVGRDEVLKEKDVVVVDIVKLAGSDSTGPKTRWTVKAIDGVKRIDVHCSRLKLRMSEKAVGKVFEMI